jgi:predicted AAA+ superfamily ATPase
MRTFGLRCTTRLRPLLPHTALRHRVCQAQAITQSLAGRIGQLHLLPLSLEELRRFPSYPDDLWGSVFTGGYPRIYDRGLVPAQWLGDYLATYVQRDVRQVLNVADLDAFTTFLRLVAARTGQELNLLGLGSDAGVTHNTARAWISVLEASFIVFRTPAWHRNLRKRAIKRAKLHFVDTGLACWLLGIREPDHLRLHPLRGALFESWVASEVLKARLHNARPADLFHLRQDRGAEVDLIVEAGDRVYGVEVKSGATIASDFLEQLITFRRATKEQHPHLHAELRLVHGGTQTGRRNDVQLVPWGEVQALEW